jgi:hypothetical protein
MKTPNFRRFVVAVLMVAMAGLAGCSGGNDEPDCDADSPCINTTPMVTPAPTGTSTAELTATATPLSTSTPTATSTATSTLTATSTSSPTVSATASATPTRTRTPTATSTPNPTPTVGPSATPTVAANACLPSSSLGVLVQGTDATIYNPLGHWATSGSEGAKGINVVPIETSSGIGKGRPLTTIATTNFANSCSCNSATGQTVCVANNTDVYLITGTTLTDTLTSGATNLQGFSGGTCENCGVVVDSTTNKALITMGLDTGVGGYQFLGLGATPKFETAIHAGARNTSEDASIDPVRHLVLSPNEEGNYQILNTSAGTDKSTLFNNTVKGLAPGTGLDSAGEDCTTGIALATVEDTTIGPKPGGDLFIADLTQAKFTPGAPGTWTDTASQIQHFPELTLESGISGIAVAPGTHLGIVTGEFGGNLEGVIELPPSSGTGTPAVVDWVSFRIPDDPKGNPWGQGLDPHTVTAYVSPNSKRALAVLGRENVTFLAVVDLEGLLKAPRTGHVVNEPLPAGLVTFVAE